MEAASPSSAATTLCPPASPPAPEQWWRAKTTAAIFLFASPQKQSHFTRGLSAHGKVGAGLNRALVPGQRQFRPHGLARQNRALKLRLADFPDRQWTIQDP